MRVCIDNYGIAARLYPGTNLTALLKKALSRKPKITG